MKAKYRLCGPSPWVIFLKSLASRWMRRETSFAALKINRDGGFGNWRTRVGLPAAFGSFLFAAAAAMAGAAPAASPSAISVREIDPKAAAEVSYARQIKP